MWKYLFPLTNFNKLHSLSSQSVIKQASNFSQINDRTVLTKCGFKFYTSHRQNKNRKFRNSYKINENFYKHKIYLATKYLYVCSHMHRNSNVCVYVLGLLNDTCGLFTKCVPKNCVNKTNKICFYAALSVNPLPA